MLQRRFEIINPQTQTISQDKHVAVVLKDRLLLIEPLSGEIVESYDAQMIDKECIVVDFSTSIHEYEKNEHILCMNPQMNEF